MYRFTSTIWSRLIYGHGQLLLSRDCNNRSFDYWETLLGHFYHSNHALEWLNWIGDRWFVSNNPLHSLTYCVLKLWVERVKTRPFSLSIVTRLGFRRLCSSHKIIGASLSEPHMVISAAALSIYIIIISVWYVRHSVSTCALLFLREIFEIVQLRNIAWGGLGTRLNNTIQDGKCGRLWERG